MAIVLGTGLGGLVSEIDEVLAFNYSQIPHIPVATVEFHFGKLIYGELGGKRVLAWQGRFHYYEGYTMEQVVKPRAHFQDAGCKSVADLKCGRQLESRHQERGADVHRRPHQFVSRFALARPQPRTPWAVDIPICASRTTLN